jgi:hypothetical protein
METPVEDYFTTETQRTQRDTEKNAVRLEGVDPNARFAFHGERDLRPRRERLGRVSLHAGHGLSTVALGSL